MPRSNYKDPLTGKDTRYDIIRVMYDDGKIERLSDIVKYVPKSVIAKDIHIKNPDIDKMMNKVIHTQLKKYFQIGELCCLTEQEMMGLVMAEYEALKAGENN
jgi:hypothetical protein